MAFGEASLHDDRQLPGKQARRKIRFRWDGAFSYKRIVLGLERILYRPVIVPLVAFLPAPLAYGVACLHGDLRYRLDTSRREEVMYCLEKVLGDQLNVTERARTARDFFRLRSCMAIDQMRITGKGRALARLVEIRGLEHIEAALEAGKGAILCFAHYGSFNCGLSLIGASGFPISVVGRWATNKADNRLSPLERFFYRITVQRALARHRRQPNIEPSGQIEVAVRAAKVLRRNGLLAIPMDAPLLLPSDRPRAVPVDFLNGQVLLLPGATTIARSMKAPLLMMFMYRSEDWRHQILEISPPLSLEGDTASDLKRCLAVAETAIRQHPAHWHFWAIRGLVTLGLLPEEALKNKKL
jgi:KDO2-lipid IV(A) lauroyltransferase